MDIRIGIRESSRELTFESAQSAGEVEAQIASALDSGANLLKLTDSKGKLYLVATASIAFIEIGVEESRRVGFIA